MGFISNFSGFRSASFAAERKDEGVVGRSHVAPTSKLDGNDAKARIDKKEIEQLYLTDPQTFNQIDLYATIPMQAGYTIKALQKGAQEQYQDFFDSIGNFGLVNSEKALMYRLLHDAPLYGYAYAEKIFGVDDYDKVRLVDFKPIDAKLIDYARDREGGIQVDRNQKPIGYTMKVGVNSRARGDIIPREYSVELGQDKIFILRERIACILFKPYGNGFESMGIVEPAYRDIVRKQIIKDTYANSVNNSADYKTYAVVGDATRAPSKALLDSTLQTLQNWVTNRHAVFPYPTQVQTLKTDHSPAVEDFLRFERAEQSTASGIALGIAVGSGEAVNRQTMSQQQIILDMKMEGWMERFSEQFTREFLDPLYEFNEYKSKAVLEWNDINLDDKLEKTNLMLTALEKGLLAPEELREYVISSFGLTANEEAYNKLKVNKEKERKEFLKAKKEENKENKEGKDNKGSNDDKKELEE